jgi:hypothetical protein
MEKPHFSQLIGEVRLLAIYAQRKTMTSAAPFAYAYASANSATEASARA